MSRASMLQYGALAIPLSFAGLPLYLHAPDFYAVEMGLSLALIGAIILAIRIFDAVQDPIIGVLSDKYAAHRTSIMMGALVTLVASFLMVFHPPETDAKTVVAVWFAVSILLASTAFSILGINLNSLGSLWSEDKDEKTRITTWREALGLVGLLVAAVLPAVIDLKYMAYTLALLCVITGFYFWSWAKKNSFVTKKMERFSFNWCVLIQSKMRGYYFIYAISMLASSIPGVLVIFFVRDRLDAEDLTGLFLILYFVSGAIGMPLWQKISKDKDKLMAWFISMLLAIATFIWAFFLGEGDVVAYGLVCFFSGLALGAELALPPAILSDLIDEKKDTAQTGFYFSAQAFILKSTFAAGSGLAFLILGFSTFVPAGENTPEALMSLSFAYALLPCLIKIAAALSLYIWMKSILNLKGNNNENHKNSTHDRRNKHA